MNLYKITIILFTCVLFFFSQSIAQEKESNVSKYQEFALFVIGEKFPESITDTTINLDFWYEYQSKINADWPNMDSTRLTPMSLWQQEELMSKTNDTLTLLYPFSGPDFLHAYILFPNAKNYIFMAQEQLGEIPDLSSMKEKDLKDYLDKFYYSIRDIYQRSYFITGRMNTDLNNVRIKGVLPVILFFMAKTDHYIYDVVYEKLSSEKDFSQLNSITGRFSAAESVKIKFRSPSSENPKELRYFRCDLSDDGLNNAPLFKSYLCNLQDYNTYVKSASYLLHYETFTTMRNSILKNSKSVLQDDTGIPYKYFNITNWDSYLYGVYVRPIDDFPNPYLFQNDLKNKYDSGENIYTLPFSLGYHWRSGDQNQMLFIKK